MMLGGSHSAFSILYMLLYGPARVALFEEYRRRTKAVNAAKQSKIKAPTVP